MTRKTPQLEQFVSATQTLLRALIRRETVRLSRQAAMVQKTTLYRTTRDEQERASEKKRVGAEKP